MKHVDFLSGVGFNFANPAWLRVASLVGGRPGGLATEIVGDPLLCRSE